MRRYYLTILLCLAVLSSVSYIKTLVDNKSKLAASAPETKVVVNQKTYGAHMASYCWMGLDNQSKCVNTLGATDLLKEKRKIKVKRGEKVSLIVRSHLKPNETSLYLVNGGTQKNVKLINNTFTAPTERGTYYYTYGAWWMKSDKILSHGDVFYVFALKVN